MGYSCDLCNKIIDEKDKMLFKYSLGAENKSIMSIMISDNSRKFYVCRICGFKLENAIFKAIMQNWRI